MRYLLTAKEYAALTSRPEAVEVERRDAALEAARAAILHLAKQPCVHDRLPAKEGDPPSARRRARAYCDDCPVAAIRPAGPDLICTKRKEWSK